VHLERDRLVEEHDSVPGPEDLDEAVVERMLLLGVRLRIPVDKVKPGSGLAFMHQNKI
jgi:hypothetical protein